MTFCFGREAARSVADSWPSASEMYFDIMDQGACSDS